VCLHGFTDTWRTWELVLDALERRDPRTNQIGVVPRSKESLAAFEQPRVVLAYAGGRVLVIRTSAVTLLDLARVQEGELPADVKRSMELWVGCVAGALSDHEFVSLLGEAGFENPTVEFTRVYDVADAHAFLVNTGVDADRIAHEVAGRIGAAFVGATKPLPVNAAPTKESRSCGCADDCCA